MRRTLADLSFLAAGVVGLLLLPIAISIFGWLDLVEAIRARFERRRSRP